MVTFVEAARSLPIFKTVECVAVPFNPSTKSKTRRVTATPLAVASKLGIAIKHKYWTARLQHPGILDNFQSLLDEQRFQHAETQILYSCEELLRTSDDADQIHPYIGCSKLCCLLCLFFINRYNGFGIRGTHLTVMNKWTLPMHALDGGLRPKFEGTARSLLESIKSILERTFAEPPSPQRTDAIAQSSLAIPTAQTIAEEELAVMERSITQMLPMSLVLGNSIFLTPNHGKRGYSTVWGGGLPKPQDMLLSEAERLKSNILRSTSGLEKINEFEVRPNAR